MTFGFALFAMPSFAQENAVNHVADTIETKANIDCCPAKTTITNQQAAAGIVAGSDLMLSQKEKMRRPVIRNYTCPQHTEIVAHHPGRCSQCGALLHRSVKNKNNITGIGKYACAEHPDVTGKKGSKCTQCGKVIKIKKQSSLKHPHTLPVCINPGKSGKCRSCNSDLLRSSKEKMKMEVMNICCCHTE